MSDDQEDEKANTMQDVIVKREFSVGKDDEFVHGHDQRYRIITLLFFRPELHTEAEDYWYECTYEIRVDGNTVRRHSLSGIDSVAALLAAMRAAVGDIDDRYQDEWKASIPSEYWDDIRGSS